MPRIISSITINRPAEQVFQFATDYASVAQWSVGVIDAAITSPDGMRVGATFRWVAQIVGQKMETKGEITAYDPPHASAWKSSGGPFPVSGSLTCEAVAGGTRVTQTVDAEPGGFFKLAEGLLMKQVQGQWDESLKKLKQVLEA
jgi:uncharacterized protein YndB with AHSA1/START domain